MQYNTKKLLLDVEQLIAQNRRFFKLKISGAVGHLLFQALEFPGKLLFIQKLVACLLLASLEFALCNPGIIDTVDNVLDTLRHPFRGDGMCRIITKAMIVINVIALNS